MQTRDRPALRVSRPPIHRIWIFTTGFAGEYATRLALAQAFEGATVSTYAFPGQDNPGNVPPDLDAADIPDILIHSYAQQDELDYLFTLKKRYRGHPLIVIWADPGSSGHRNQVDIVINPQHLERVGVSPSRLIEPLGLPSLVNYRSLNAAAEEWSDFFARMPRPIVAVLIGGQTEKKNLVSAVARDLGKRVTALVKANGGSLLVTNSRRTTEPATRAFLDEISGVPVYFFNAREEDPGPNPYFAYLAYADHIVVTGDSYSMLSDAASTGKPVHVFAPNSIVEARHKRLILDLVQSNRARILGAVLENWSYQPLNVAEEVRLLIEARLGCGNFLHSL